MSDYRNRNRQIAAALQLDSLGGADYGTEATINPASDAIKVRVGSAFDPQFDNLETDYLQGALDQSEPITGGGMVRRQMPCYLKGSGAAGTAPDVGKLLRSAAFEEVVTAVAVAGTAQAGAAGSITLASGASSTANLFRGMVIAITDGEGAGQKRVVTAYNGTTKVASVYPDWDEAPDATSEYEIGANVLYRPRSVGLQPISIAEWAHSTVVGGLSRRRRLMDGASTFTLNVTPRALAQIDFTVSGKLAALPDDVAKPAAPTLQASEPTPILNALAFLGGQPIKFNEFTFDAGNDVQMADDPTALYGYGAADIVNRTAQGRLVVPMRQLSAGGDHFNRWLAGTPDQFWVHWGPGPGDLVSIWLPRIKYTGAAPGETRGYGNEQCPYRSNSPDATAFICIG